MPTGEPIRDRLDAMTADLRDRVAQLLQTTTDDLSALIELARVEAADAAARQAREEAARQADDRLAGAVAAAESRVAAAESHVAGAEERGRQDGHRQGRQDGFDAGLAQGRREAEDAVRRHFEAAAIAESEWLLHAVQEIDRARSLTEVLDTLANSAGHEAARVALLIVSGDRLRGWRLTGFDPSIDNPAKLDIGMDAAGVVADAIRGAVAISVDSPTRPAPSFVKIPPGQRMIAVPLMVDSRVVAVLYADQAGSRDSIPNAHLAWSATLEVLARHAARTLQAVTAAKATRVLTDDVGISGGIRRSA
jgi:hypothetical protein